MRVALVVAMLASFSALAEPSPTRLSASGGVPWGYAFGCDYLFRAPCGFPLAVGVRFEKTFAPEGVLANVRDSFSFEASVEVQGYVGGGAHFAIGVLPLIAVRWSVDPWERVGLCALVELGASLYPTATQFIALYVNPLLAVRVALTEHQFLRVEAGPFGGRLVVGTGW